MAVIDTANGRQWQYRGSERFPMCSTFKLLLAAQMLQRDQQGLDSLQQRVTYPRSALVPYSPTTEAQAGGAGLTVAELCEAAVVLSDNTAANLLLARQGGPQGLTQWLRDMGSMHTRLDRLEPALNSAVPGDERDTTTPLSMARAVVALAKGPHLDAGHQAQLLQWLKASPTGAKRLRAGMPPGWLVGGKTGTGDNGTANDVVLVWPHHRPQPLVVSAYLTQTPQLAPAARDAALAEVGQAVAHWFRRF
ncbi:beta-lactamase [Comamonas terrigena NBRC 13299]|nr:beta-lactamase [Comamonas terrigena NBRC 13299]